jgi:hypothetical protein
MKTSYAALLGLIGAIAFGAATGCNEPFEYGPRSGSSGGSVPEVVTYEGDVYPILFSECATCHAAGGAASSTDLVLTNDADADYDMIFSLVTPGDPEGSLLLQKASGATSHVGGSTLPETSIDYQTIAAWVEQGAE